MSALSHSSFSMMVDLGHCVLRDLVSLSYLVSAEQIPPRFLTLRSRV